MAERGAGDWLVLEEFAFPAKIEASLTALSLELNPDRVLTRRKSRPFGHRFAGDLHLRSVGINPVLPCAVDLQDAGPCGRELTVDLRMNALRRTQPQVGCRHNSNDRTVLIRVDSHQARL